jgi:hypothetical protein
VFDKRKRDSLVLVVVVVGKGKSEVTLTGKHTQTRRDISALHIIFLGDLINFSLYTNLFLQLIRYILLLNSLDQYIAFHLI